MRYINEFFLLHKRFGFALLFFFVLFCGAILSGKLAESSAHIVPAYPKEEITQLFYKENIEEADYKKILYQVGLGRPAVDKLRQTMTAIDNPTGANLVKHIKRLQDNFFREVEYTHTSDYLILCEEKIVGENGDIMKGTEFIDLQDGDILITKCCRVYGWRNGHAALVVDAEKGRTIESVVLGEDSCIQSINKWSYYPSFMVLRLKEAPKEFRKQVADWAIQNLNNLPYHFSVGLFSNKEGKDGIIEGTQCAHLVWSAYRQFGYDLDSNGGRIVTPKDLANSSWLEIVQLYGVNPKSPWD